MIIKRRLFSTTLGRVRQEGLLDGRVKFHHTTRTENIPSIHKRGLLIKKSFDKNNWTSQIGGMKPSRDGIVYLAKDRRTTKKIKESMEKRGFGSASILDLSIPYKDYCNLKKVQNPHLLGSKTYNEWEKKYAKERNLDLNNPKDRLRLKKGWKNIIEGTETIGEDILPVYIKSSDSYKRNTIKDTTKYIKDNPKRFFRGLRKSIVGLVKYPFEYKSDAIYYK